MSDDVEDQGAEIIPMPGASDSSRSRNGPVHRQRSFMKLRTLKCFKEMHQMLLDGFGPAAVADFIQKEKKEHTDITRTSLIYTLRKYRAEIPKTEVMQPKLPDHVEKVEARVRASLNELDELHDLYLLQRNRIDIDVALEKQVKKLIPTTGQEVRIAADMLRTSAQLKIDIGMSASIIGGAQADGSLSDTLSKRVTNAAAAKVLEDPQSRLRLTALATKLLGMAADPRIEKVLQGPTTTSAEPPSPPVIQEAEVVEVPESPPPPPPVSTPDVLPPIMSGDSEPGSSE